MKKVFVICALSGALTLSACGSADTTEPAVAADEVASAAECTQETLMAKGQELATKMQGMAGDPAAMQELGAKMQEIQAKVQAGAADGSFTTQQACDAYDEMLAAAS